jgi:hypothetical protein
MHSFGTSEYDDDDQPARAPAFERHHAVRVEPPQQWHAGPEPYHLYPGSRSPPSNMQLESPPLLRQEHVLQQHLHAAEQQLMSQQLLINQQRQQLLQLERQQDQHNRGASNRMAHTSAPPARAPFSSVPHRPPPHVAAASSIRPAPGTRSMSLTPPATPKIVSSAPDDEFNINATLAEAAAAVSGTHYTSS